MKQKSCSFTGETWHTFCLLCRHPSNLVFFCHCAKIPMLHPINVRSLFPYMTHPNIHASTFRFGALASLLSFGLFRSILSVFGDFTHSHFGQFLLLVEAYLRLYFYSLNKGAYSLWLGGFCISCLNINICFLLLSMEFGLFLRSPWGCVRVCQKVSRNLDLYGCEMEIC